MVKWLQGGGKIDLIDEEESLLRLLGQGVPASLDGNVLEKCTDAYQTPCKWQMET